MMLARALIVMLFSVPLLNGACHRSEPKQPVLTSAKTPIVPKDAGHAEAPPHPDQAPLSPDAPKTPRLPEDPVIGKRSQLQWLEHRKREDRERRLESDRERLAQHRRVVALLVSERERYDRARTKATAQAAQAGAPRRITQLEARIKEFEHVDTPLLTEYEALLVTLKDDYATARLAALAGEQGDLQRLQLDFDKRLARIDSWLKEAEQTRDEYEKR